MNDWYRLGLVIFGGVSFALVLANGAQRRHAQRERDAIAVRAETLLRISLEQLLGQCDRMRTAARGGRVPALRLFTLTLDEYVRSSSATEHVKEERVKSLLAIAIGCADTNRTCEQLSRDSSATAAVDIDALHDLEDQLDVLATRIVAELTELGLGAEQVEECRVHAATASNA